MDIATSAEPETIAEANAILFEHYLQVIEGATHVADPMEGDGRLSLENLRWLCRTALDTGESLPEDKTSRWLGFVQCGLAMRGLIDVDAERDLTRPLFHAVYRARDIPIPAPRAASGGGET